MTASPATPSATARRLLPAPDSWTAAGAAVALGCTLAGTYVETPWKASGDGAWGADFGGNGGWATLAVVVAFVAVALVLVGLATARARTVPAERTARRALVLALLGAAAIAVFWTGAPAVLAGGAAGLALDARRRSGRLPGSVAAALALAFVTVAAAVWLAVTG
jgi:hypothetical protein